jgi:deoxyribodipyrimidine photo-lyase
MPKHVFFWFRRDLRLEDNRGLVAALKSGLPVRCVFIFDRHILDKLEDKDDARLTFIHESLQKLNSDLSEHASRLEVFYGKPEELWSKIIHDDTEALFVNRDYEPYAIKRDAQVAETCKRKGVDFQHFKDHIIFEGSEVLSDSEKPYKVFTPYSRKWKKVLDEKGLGIQKLPKSPSFYPAADLGQFKYSGHSIDDKQVSLTTMGFEASQLDFPARKVEAEIIRKYADNRDFPGLKKGTSRLGVHLRFGTLSIRQLAKYSSTKSEVYLRELIWRDFYSAILQHFPHVAEGSFKPEWDQFEWETNEDHFEAWCEGKTGYPLVDAGMRELNETGFMHNRVRMVCASFLCKHLLISWKWGEAWFARKLLDFDLASNNGGWQWAAGSGCDAQPWFRIFNPTSQLQKFDPKGDYVKRWLPEWSESVLYESPVVEHKWARERTLARFKAAFGK